MILTKSSFKKKLQHIFFVVVFVSSVLSFFGNIFPAFQSGKEQLRKPDYDVPQTIKKMPAFRNGKEPSRKSQTIKMAPPVNWTKQLLPKNAKLHQFSFAREGDDKVKQNTIPRSLMLLDNKLLLCPTPKSGSTSIYESILLPMNLYNSSMSKTNRCWIDCDISAWRLFEKDKANRKMVMEAPSFTVVRNPWDRVRSCYKGKIERKSPQMFIPSKENPNGNIQRKIKLHGTAWLDEIKPMSFVEFVSHVEKYPDANEHWKPHSRLCLSVDENNDGNIFTMIILSNLKMDYSSNWIFFSISMVSLSRMISDLKLGTKSPTKLNLKKKDYSTFTILLLHKAICRYMNL